MANWDVGNVVDVGCLFEFCTLLEDISALAYWDLSNVFNITELFRGCVNLKNISPLARWDLHFREGCLNSIELLNKAKAPQA